MERDRRVSTTLAMTLCLGLVLALSSCEPHDDLLEPQPDPTQNSLSIQSAIEGFESAWRLSMPDGTLVHGEGDSILTDAELGEYRILWKPIETWNSPKKNPDSRTLTLDSDETLIASYQRIQGDMGDILVQPEPKELRARWALQGPDGFFAAGKGNRLLKRRAVGDYTVTWESVDGFVTPPASTSTLEAEATLELMANYDPEAVATGTITIDPNPDSLNAPWQLEGPSGATYSGAGDATLTEMPYGDYTLTWGEVQGYAPPSPNPVAGTLGSAAKGELLLGQPEPAARSTKREVAQRTI